MLCSRAAVFGHQAVYSCAVSCEHDRTVGYSAVGRKHRIRLCVAAVVL